MSEKLDNGDTSSEDNALDPAEQSGTVASKHTVTSVVQSIKQHFIISYFCLSKKRKK